MGEAIEMHLRESISGKRSDIAIRSQEARKKILNKQCISGTSADLLEDLSAQNPRKILKNQAK